MTRKPRQPHVRDSPNTSREEWTRERVECLLFVSIYMRGEFEVSGVTKCFTIARLGVHRNRAFQRSLRMTLFRCTPFLLFNNSHLDNS